MSLILQFPAAGRSALIRCLMLLRLNGLKVSLDFFTRDPDGGVSSGWVNFIGSREVTALNQVMHGFGRNLEQAGNF